MLVNAYDAEVIHLDIKRSGILAGTEYHNVEVGVLGDIVNCHIIDRLFFVILELGQGYGESLPAVGGGIGICTGLNVRLPVALRIVVVGG